MSNFVEQFFLDVGTAVFVFGVNVVSAVGEFVVSLIRAVPG